MYLIVGVLTNLLLLIVLYFEATAKQKPSFFTSDTPKLAEDLGEFIIGIGIWNIVWLITSLFFS